jgi:hypothetical protein
VNGTLEGEDLALVNLHLQDCARCQRELQWQRELQTAYVESDISPDAAQSFNRLRPRLSQVRTGRRHAVCSINLPGLRGFPQQWSTWAVAAQFGVIVVLSALLVSGGELSPTYRTLGASEASQPAMGSLVVIFDPTITEAEMRRILLGIGARVVDGPTKAGAYVLHLPPQEAAAALKSLRAERSVTLAESLGPEKSP